MKKLMIVALATFMGNQAIADDGAAFMSGTMLGTGLGMIASSNNNRQPRSAAYYDSKDRADQRSEIRQQIKSKKKDIRVLKKQNKRLQKKNNDGSNDTKITKNEGRIEEHNNDIDDLNIESRSL